MTLFTLTLWSPSRGRFTVLVPRSQVVKELRWRVYLGYRVVGLQ